MTLEAIVLLVAIGAVGLIVTDTRQAISRLEKRAQTNSERMARIEERCKLTHDTALEKF